MRTLSLSDWSSLSLSLSLSLFRGGRGFGHAYFFSCFTGILSSCDIYVYTLCPRKNSNPVYVAITLANNVRTKFYTYTETLNCKQVTKFQQNRSTSTTATASLVRSLKSISVHYGHRRDWLSIDCANGKTPADLKSVFKMSTVCSNASSKTWTPLPDDFIDDHLVKMFPLFDQHDFSWSTSRGCGTHAPAASTKSASRLG